jgi:hypothetical protein
LRFDSSTLHVYKERNMRYVPQKLEGHEYPFHIATEQETVCHNMDCDRSFYPTVVHNPVLVEVNEGIRKDTIEYTTVCPHCGQQTKACFVYYYD